MFPVDFPILQPVKRRRVQLRQRQGGQCCADHQRGQRVRSVGPWNDNESKSNIRTAIPGILVRVLWGLLQDVGSCEGVLKAFSGVLCVRKMTLVGDLIRGFDRCWPAICANLPPWTPSRACEPVIPSQKFYTIS